MSRWPHNNDHTTSQVSSPIQMAQKCVSCMFVKKTMYRFQPGEDGNLLQGKPFWTGTASDPFPLLQVIIWRFFRRKCSHLYSKRGARSLSLPQFSWQNIITKQDRSEGWTCTVRSVLHTTGERFSLSPYRCFTSRTKTSLLISSFLVRGSLWERSRKSVSQRYTELWIIIADYFRV